MEILGFDMVSNDLPSGKLNVRILKTDGVSIFSSKILIVPREDIYDLSVMGHDMAYSYATFLREEDWEILKNSDYVNIKNCPKFFDWIQKMREDKISSIIE